MEGGGFYRYYRLGQPDVSDPAGAEDGSTEGEEPRDDDTTGVVGLHSLFGQVAHIAEERGLTHHQVLWECPWALFALETSDKLRPLTREERRRQSVRVSNSMAEIFSNY